MLIGETLAHSAARLPDKAVFISGGARTSFAGLDAAASRFAHALLADGLAKGETVAILCGNHVPHAVAYFGTARTGGIAAHLSNRYAEDEIAHTLKLVDAVVAVVDAEFAGLVSGLSRDLPKLRRIVVVGQGGTPGEAEGAVSFDAYIDGRADTVPDIAIADTDPASITFTGGTTGFPKAALLTHRARTVWCETAIDWFSLGPDDTLAVASPMYHAAGMFIWVQPGILAGATAVLLGHWDVADFIAEIERAGATGAFLVPAQIKMLIDDPAFDEASDSGRLRSLKKIVYGGAPSPPGLIERADAAMPHTEFIQNYGQTEIGPMVTLYARDRARKPDAIGLPTSRCELGIFAQPGVPAAPDEVGEIAVRGDSVMIGYVNGPDETAAFFKTADGWGYTGDMGYADEDGLITLVDRAKDVIIAGGVNIYPAEIERVLFTVPGIDDCAAFGVADEKWGEVPLVAVVLQPGAALNEQEIADICADRIARHKRPRRIHIVDAIPKTGAGKILRPALREMVGEG